MTHPASTSAGRPAARRRIVLAAVAAAAGIALFIAGCSQAIPTPLPELIADAREVLSDEEQKRAIEELTSKQETHEREAVRQIENEKAR
jgi:hypothetical protein